MHHKLIPDLFLILAAITCQEFFYKSDILKEDYQKGFKKLTLFFFRTASHHLYVPVSHAYVIRMSVVCHSYLLVCHQYVTRMSSVCHSYVIRMSLVCTRMSSAWHWYVVLPWTTA